LFIPQFYTSNLGWDAPDDCLGLCWLFLWRNWEGSSLVRL